MTAQIINFPISHPADSAIPRRNKFRRGDLVCDLQSGNPGVVTVSMGSGEYEILFFSCAQGALVPYKTIRRPATLRLARTQSA